MRYRKFLFFAFAILLFITVWSRQTAGIIRGTVKDAKTKLPVADAVITLSSDAFKGQKFAVTNVKGIYKLNNLPVGRYIIKFEMEGYKKSVHDSITLQDGMSVGVNAEMVKEPK